jgi:hypothetical protein
MSETEEITGWDYSEQDSRYERMFGTLLGTVSDLGNGFWRGELRSPVARLTAWSCADVRQLARQVERAAKEEAAKAPQAPKEGE